MHRQVEDHNDYERRTQWSSANKPVSFSPNLIELQRNPNYQKLTRIRRYKESLRFSPAMEEAYPMARTSGSLMKGSQGSSNNNNLPCSTSDRKIYWTAKSWSLAMQESSPTVRSMHGTCSSPTGEIFYLLFHTVSTSHYVYNTNRKGYGSLVLVAGWKTREGNLHLKIYRDVLTISLKGTSSSISSLRSPSVGTVPGERS